MRVLGEWTPQCIVSLDLCCHRVGESHISCPWESLVLTELGAGFGVAWAEADCALCSLAQTLRWLPVGFYRYVLVGELVRTGEEPTT